MNTKNEIFEKVFHDYLHFSENYSDHLTVQELGYYIAKIVSKMIFDCAPSERVGRKTIQAGVEEGLEWSLSERDNEKGVKDEFPNT